MTRDERDKLYASARRAMAEATARGDTAAVVEIEKRCAEVQEAENGLEPALRGDCKTAFLALGLLDASRALLGAAILHHSTPEKQGGGP